MSAPALLDKLLLVLAPFHGDGAETAFRKLVKLTGWDLNEVAGFDADAALHDLSAISGAVQDLTRYLGQPPQSLADFARLLEDAGRAFDAVRDLRRVVATAGPSHLDDFSRALVDALILLVWMHFSPVTLALAELLGLVTAPIDSDPLPELTDGGRVVRRSHQRVQLHFDKLGPLLGDPVAALAGEYFANDALATTAGAHAAADKLFPRLGRFAEKCGAGVSYGLHPSVRTSGDAAVRERMEHMLALYTIRDDGAQGLRLALSSAQRGHRGLVVSPFGSIAETLQVGGFDVTLSAGGDADGFLVGAGGVTLVGGASWTLDLAAALPSGEGEPLERTLGGAGGSGVTWKTLKAEGKVTLPGQASIVFRAEGVRFQLAPADGDGFLSRVLPSSLGAGVDVGFGWSSARGFWFEGGAGLAGSWPIHRNIGPILLDRFGLRLEAGGAGLALAAGLVCGLTLGPLALIVDGVGLAAQLGFPASGGNLGVADLDLAFQPPRAVGISIDSPLVSGGGFVGHAGGEYQGVLDLSVSGVAVKAYGLIETDAAGYSFLVVLSAEFSPGVALPFGFTLDGVGGLLGVHRRVDLDAVSAALWSHHLDGLLFPHDPIASAPGIMRSIDALFPAAEGRYLFGPLARIGWGRGLLTGVVGLLLEVPEPLKLFLVGEIRVGLPRERPQLELHVDFDGGVDLGKKLAFFDASLHHSRIESYPISGDLAFRWGWGAEQQFALAIGGFHPHFQPPAGFPPLRRVAITIGESGAQLVAQAYLALTANTLQFGAHAELTAGGSWNVHGWLGIDALCEWSPFSFLFDLSAGIELRHHSSVIASVHLDGHLAGPTPWHVWGSASLSLVFFDISVDFDTSWGDEAPSLPPMDPAPAVAAALADHAAFRSLSPARAAVTCAGQPADAGGAVLLDPGGALRVSQQVVPLGQPITRFGGVQLAQPRSFDLAVDVAGVTGGRPADEEFALGQFVELSDAELLSLPSFTRLAGGVEVGGDAVDLGRSARARSVVTRLDYDTTIIDSITHKGPRYTLDAAAFATLSQRAQPMGPGRYAPPEAAPRVALAEERWLVANLDLSPSGAVVHDGTKYGALRALAVYLDAHPGARGQLQVVRSAETG
jgi:hypothetical protein